MSLALLVVLKNEMAEECPTTTLQVVLLLLQKWAARH